MPLSSNSGTTRSDPGGSPKHPFRSWDWNTVSWGNSCSRTTSSMPRNPPFAMPNRFDQLRTRPGTSTGRCDCPTAAGIHLELGRTELSKTLLEAVIAAEPRNAFAYYLQGQIAYEGEAFEAAVTRYETVLNLQPAATQLHAPLGLAYRNLGNQNV